MVFGSHLQLSWGSEQQREYRAGWGLAPSSALISCRGLVLGAPIEAPKVAMAQQIAPGSSLRERAQGSQVPGSPRSLCAQGQPHAGWGPEASARHLDRHASPFRAPRKRNCWCPCLSSNRSPGFALLCICAARVPLGKGKAGSRGAATGCGALSRGNR